MRFDKFTIKAQEAVQEAQELAESKRQQQILAAHLLEVLLTQEQGIVIPLLKKLGIDTDSVLDKTIAAVNKLPQISGSGAPGQAYVSAELRDTFNLAWEEAGKLKDEFVSTEHLLLALAGPKNTVAGRILNDAGVQKENIYLALKRKSGVVNGSLTSILKKNIRRLSVIAMIWWSWLERKAGPRYRA